MSKTVTRRLVAGTSAAAVAAGMAVTMGVGAASAAPGSNTWTHGSTKFTQTISNTTPLQGDTITSTYKFERTGGVVEYIQQVRDNHNACLTFVGAKVDGSARGLESSGADFARLTGSWAVYPNISPKSATFEFTYKVGANCARETPLKNFLNYNGTLGAGGPYDAKAPTFSIAKNVTEMSITDVHPEMGKVAKLQAQVRGSIAGDPVDFLDGTTLIGTGTTNAEGWATVDWTPTSAGVKTINVKYAATPFTTAIDGSKSVSVAASNAASTTTLAADPAQVGRASNLTATVSPASAGGVVEFLVGGVRAGLATIGADGKAVYSWTPATAGNLAVTAKFLGVNAVAGSESTINVTVAQKPAGSVSSETALRVDGTPQVGVPINLIANVDPKDKGGTVAFSVNGVQVGSAPVGDGGIAIFAWTPTEAGTKDLKATYSGAAQVDSSSGTATTTVAPGAVGPGGPGTDPGTGSLGSLGGLFGSLGS